MPRIRDAERTRGRVISAAAKEFSLKGYDATTLSAVARRANVSKQLLSHHFPTKEALFEAVHNEKFRPIQQWVEGLPDDPRHLAAARFNKRKDNMDYMRFLVWEAARGKSRAVPGERDRQKSISEYGKAIKQAQIDGKLTSDFDFRMIHLAALSLATFPLTFTQLTRLVTGRNSDDPKFQMEWTRFLEMLGERLFASDEAGSTSLERSQKPSKFESVR
ncbi:helix-turn-helix domain-containing protein [Bradyrhizobium sp. LHD-71]|uniref:TetR/AcrR family transcriptional regulator n=1 Tax=Bradyrhizobium sp. LHD-71 TaxID=3072141 RepID=UPI00280F08A0|nr:helix-turn-helix domain-containing protein [Bradyrhizobium sp. LHD-71]MDQ8731460.1 helix-turn-helix domain-containing protein [Bradyrhizobium sp. LHD-71]